jgi:hemerythrin-like domain-containing protein
MHPTAPCDHLRHDHRQMEEYLDRLFAAVSHPGPELVSQVRGAIGSLQRLEAAHFEREESLFYPKLRPAFPDLLGKMDLQHEDVRELDHLVSELLPDPPEFPEARWADELRRPCIELHDRIQHHIVDEEDQLFRLADRDLTPDDQAMLAAAFKRMQSRPLRRAPDQVRGILPGRGGRLPDFGGQPCRSLAEINRAGIRRRL